MHDTRRWSLPAVIGAIGIVYGDIGTSPLYALETALNATGGFDPLAVLGCLSLIFWSLMLSVTFKYVTVMMRADNQGEGGILALFALAQRAPEASRHWFRWLIGLALAGTAFFFCDALITPAISVLSAVEGLEMLDPDFEKAVIPVTLAVLALLFFIQKRGTARVGRLFGPVMIFWFLVIAVFGVTAITRHPSVLIAINPVYGIQLLATHSVTALAILGGVFLALTGGEALYADMGHFGKTPVRIAWFALVWPALLLNYFGQGALLLEHGAMIEHPLYAMVPATAAAVDVDSGDGCHGHCLAGGDFRGLLRGAPGSAARPAAPHPHSADLGAGAGADLRSHSQHAAVPGGRRLCVGLQVLRGVVGSVWRGGCRHDVHYQHPGRIRGRHPMALAALGSRRGLSATAGHGFGFPGRQPDQAGNGRLDPDHPGRGPVLRVLDVAQWSPRAARGAGQDWPCHARSWRR